jgi:hypothetical protein
MKGYSIGNIEIAALLILLISFSLILFSGCINDENNKQNEKDLFLGTWTAEDINLSYIFYKNNTYRYKIGTNDVLGSWKINNSQLNLTLAGNSELFNYSFTDDKKSLTLTPIKFNFSYTLNKQMMF